MSVVNLLLTGTMPVTFLKDMLLDADNTFAIRRRAVAKIVGPKNAPAVVTLGFIALW